MGHGEIMFQTEAGIDPFRVHAEIAGIGAHETGYEAGGFKRFQIAVFDGGNKGGTDVKLALDIQQGFAQRRPLAAQKIAQTQLIIVEATLFVLLLRRRLFLPPDHPHCPCYRLPIGCAFHEAIPPVVEN